MVARGRWWRFGALLVITALVLVPVAVPIYQTVVPQYGRGGSGFGGGGGIPGGALVGGFLGLFGPGSMTGLWLANSVSVALGTVILTVVIGAPAGYVLSRARSRLIGPYSLLLFVVQAVPVIVLVVPLFIYFAQFGLYDNLFGLAIIYVAMSLPVATWMTGSYIDSIPIELEEAAWLDGCSVLTGFIRVVLRSSLPGILSTAIFSFLLVWNDYLICFVFLRSAANYTLPIALRGGGASALLLMLPPIVVFAVLNRYFRFGGLAGALADR